MILEGCRLTKISSLFIFLSFSAVVVADSLEVVALGSGGSSVSSMKRGMLMVMSFVISVEKSMVSGSDSYEVIVGVDWYLVTYLLVS